MNTAKILEFSPPKKSYLVFVSLREKKIILDYVYENFNHHGIIDEGEIVAIHFHLSKNMVNKIREKFPNIHIIEGTL